jgi:ribosomal protein S20
MSVEFSDFLNEMEADADRIQQALRIYLSERTDDMTPDEMTTELRARATDAKEFSNTLRSLEQSPEAVEQAALLYFEREWENENRRSTIRAIFENAKNQLPVVETAIIAVAAMYAIHMLITKGVVEKKKTIRRKRDGTFETVVLEKAEAFHPILAAIAKVVGNAGEE